MADSQSFNRYYIQIKKVWERPTVRKFSEATATLFLIAFFLLAALKPTIETIFTLNKKITDAHETEVAMTNKIANINRAQSLYRQVEPNLPLVDEYFPPEANVQALIDIIGQNLKSSGIDTTGTNYDFSSYYYINATASAVSAAKTSSSKVSSAKNEPNKIAFNLDAKSDYVNIWNFLNNLTQAKRLILFDRISLSKTSSEKAIDFSLDSKVLYEKK